MDKKTSIFIGGSIDKNISGKYALFAGTLGEIINEREDYQIVFDGCEGLPSIVLEKLNSFEKSIVCFTSQYRTRYTNYDNPRIASLIEVKKQSQMTDKIIEIADAFIFLKGGLCTYEELIRTINTKKNKEHDKPIVIINIDHEMDDLIILLSSCNVSDYYYITDNVWDCLNFIEGELYRESSKFYQCFIKNNYIARNYPIIVEKEQTLNKKK